MNNFDELIFEQNEKKNNIIFSLFRRSSIVDLFKKIFHIRFKIDLKPFIFIFEL